MSTHQLSGGIATLRFYSLTDRCEISCNYTFERHNGDSLRSDILGLVASFERPPNTEIHNSMKTQNKRMAHDTLRVGCDTFQHGCSEASEHRSIYLIVNGTPTHFDSILVFHHVRLFYRFYLYETHLTHDAADVLFASFLLSLTGSKKGKTNTHIIIIRSR